jgi:DNA polymerase-3 subunit gamma/tau
MAYQALYRTYRPRRFADVVDQEHVIRTLLNSVRQGKVGHAYLFSGPRGTGKTTVARLLARAINCESPVDGEPCDKCDRCKATEEGIGVLEIDAASHGSVDDMRQLVAQVSQVPLAGGMMVYIIDEVHMLSKEAFNAFLKTLEEPPPHAVFVLATTEPGKLLPTIHSRCQHFAFRRLPIGMVAEHIEWICQQEKIPAEDAAIRLIARAGDGSVRDSISVLEQAIAYEPEGLTLEGVRNVLGIPDRMNIRHLAGYIIGNDPAGLSVAYAQLIESGREPDSIVVELMGHFRDLLFTTLNLEHPEIQTLPDEEKELLKKQAEGLDPDVIHRTIAMLAKAEGEIKYEDEAALLLEVSLLRLASRFGREPSREKHPKPVEEKAEAPAEEMFPDAGRKPAPAASSDRAKEAASPETPTLTGGLTLKKKKAAQQKAEPVTEPAKTEPAPETQKKEAAKTSDEPLVPRESDPFWKNMLESIRENSVAEYVLLLDAIPDPPPSEWPKPEGDNPKTLSLILKYPFEDGQLVRMINEPALKNRINTRLEETLERPIEIQVAQERGGSDTGGSGKAKQMGMYDGEGSVGSVKADGPVLFAGAAPEVPTDPELRKIHDLIIRDFPDYSIEKGDGA